MHSRLDKLGAQGSAVRASGYWVAFSLAQRGELPASAHIKFMRQSTSQGWRKLAKRYAEED